MLFLGLKSGRRSRCALILRAPLIILLLSFTLSGCADFRQRIGLEPQSQEAGSSRQEMSTTGVSAITGAALGAGAGLVVGSTTGNAGEGLLVGAAIGTAMGAAIGTELESREVALAERRGLVERQSIEIKSQDRAIEELRQDLRDDGLGEEYKNERSSRAGYSQPMYAEAQLPAAVRAQAVPESLSDASGSFVIPAYNRSSRYAKTAPESYQGNPKAVTIDAAVARRAETRAQLREDVRARLSEPSSVTSTTPYRMEGKDQAVFEYSPPVKTKVAGVDIASNRARFSESQPQTAMTLPPARTAAPKKSISTKVATNPSPKRLELEPAITEAIPRAKQPPLKVAKAPVITSAAQDVAAAEDSLKKPNPVTSKAEAAEVSGVVEKKQEKVAALATSGANCQDAQSEAGRAKNASSDADRLFYFRRALRLCPSEPSYHIEIGKVYAAIGREEDARFEFNKALEIDPENETAQDELSLMMLESSAY